MYKIAICDDDKRYRKTIREIIEHENSLPENEIRFYEYESGNELLKHTDILHELVFIDIRMPGLDGNQTALKLRNYNKDAVLIFYSSYFEPTVDSINFGQPFRYIMKDLHDTSLRREIAAIMTEVKRRFLNDYAVTVTSAGKIIRIHVENILYVSRAKLLDFYYDRFDKNRQNAFTFKDYVEALNDFSESSTYKEDKDYWMEQISLIPPAPMLPLQKDPSVIRKPQFAMALEMRGCFQR